MRPIKFRGKAVMTIEELERYDIPHENGWVIGNLIQNGSRPMIVDDILEEIEESIYPGWWVVVHPKSVGQYTGRDDMDGKEIYGKDYVKHNFIGADRIIHVSDDNYHESVSMIDSILKSIVLMDKGLFVNLEVIGNEYDNPELLEGESND